MHASHRTLFFLLAIGLAITSLSAVAQQVIATIPVGSLPLIASVNPVTNQTYVVNLCGDDPSCQTHGTVTVIDGHTLSTSAVTVGHYPAEWALNSVTNNFYVLSQCGDPPSCQTGGTVTVIDGATLSTTTITVGFYPQAVAVNSVTNKIYVLNQCDDLSCQIGTVTIIDGVTLSTSTIPVGYVPHAVAVDSVNNKIYVANQCGDDCSSQGTVTVIDGATLSTNTVAVGFFPEAVAVDSVANRIYVMNLCGNDLCYGPTYHGTVTVIDGATLSPTTITVGFNKGTVQAPAINLVTNKTYILNQCGDDPECNHYEGTVTVIDGATLSTTTVTVGHVPQVLAVDSVNDTIYVPNGCGNDPSCNSNGTVTVIDGATNNTQTVDVGRYPRFCGVDSVTNTIYAPNQGSGTVTVIDGHTLSTSTLTVGSGPSTVAVNSVTDRAYVANGGDGTVSVIGDAPPPPTPLQFVPITACRVVDTRNPDGRFGGPPIQGNNARSFLIQDNPDCRIPSNAAAYSLNVTVVPQRSLGYLTIWPNGETQPGVSTLNSLDGRVKANAAIVSAGAFGGVSVFVTDTTNVVLDIDGYFAPVSDSTLAFYPLTPCRVADTRNPAGNLGGPLLTGGVPRDFPVLEATSCNIPNTAQAYSLNFTAVPRGPLGYLTVWPTGQTQPLVSTLNAYGGQVTANAAIVPAGNNGAIATYAYNDTDLIIDINGYFAAPGQNGLSFYAAAPCRVFDSRDNNGQPFSGALNPPVNVEGSPCAPPSTSRAYVFNATVVPTNGPMGYLTLWPDSQNQPVVSTLNAYDGFITSNMAIVPNANGSIDAYADGLTHLILDISGYFAP